MAALTASGQAGLERRLAESYWGVFSPAAIAIARTPVTPSVYRAGRHPGNLCASAARVISKMIPEISPEVIA